MGAKVSILWENLSKNTLIMNKSDLKPAVVFAEFAKINEIPRPSKREEKMIESLKSWG